MYKPVFLRLQLAENAKQGSTKIQDKTDETDQAQGQDKFHNARMPLAYDTVHLVGTADIRYKRQRAANGKDQCQYSAYPGQEIINPEFHNAYPQSKR